MTHIVLESQLGSDLADAGTTTFTLPAGYNDASIARTGHVLVVQNGGTFSNGAKDFSVSVANGVVTLTNNTETTIPSGSKLFLQLEVKGGENRDPIPTFNGRVGNAQVIIVNLGTPATADADGAVATQAATAVGGLATGINGALASGGVATFDVPRNVVAAWTNTAVLTVTGTDEYGNVVVESSASGTSLTGKKAFKTVTGISVSADVTGLTVGTGTVLGLPIFLSSTGDVIGEDLNGAKATAGTIVAGDNSEPTAVTGDVRGTYVGNSAPNGSRNYTLKIVTENQLHTGSGQFAG